MPSINLKCECIHVNTWDEQHKEEELKDGFLFVYLWTLHQIILIQTKNKKKPKNKMSAWYLWQERAGYELFCEHEHRWFFKQFELRSDH